MVVLGFLLWDPFCLALLRKKGDRAECKDSKNPGTTPAPDTNTPAGPSPAGPSPAGPSPTGPSPAGPSPTGPSPLATATPTKAPGTNTPPVSTSPPAYFHGKPLPEWYGAVHKYVIWLFPTEQGQITTEEVHSSTEINPGGTIALKLAWMEGMSFKHKNTTEKSPEEIEYTFNSANGKNIVFLHAFKTESAALIHFEKTDWYSLSNTRTQKTWDVLSKQLADVNCDVRFKVSADNYKLWDDAFTGATTDFDTYRARKKGDWYPIGDCITGENYNGCSKFQYLIQKKHGKHPTGFEKLWDDKHSQGKSGNYSLYKPIAPDGYICVGHVGSQHHGLPNKEDIMCVPACAVENGSANFHDKVWTTDGMRAGVERAQMNASRDGYIHHKDYAENYWSIKPEHKQNAIGSSFS